MPTRYLKPGICDSERIEKLSPMSECLYYRLLVNVDDYGRMDARPAVVKAKCFPLKEAMLHTDVYNCMQELNNCKLIQTYESDGKTYLQILKWDNKPRSAESKCPNPPPEPIHPVLHTIVKHLHTVLPVTVTETETETVNRKPELKPKPETGTKSLALATRLPEDWVLPKTWGDWAMQEFPTLSTENIRLMADGFRDYWIGVPGSKGKKLNWQATWRNQVRDKAQRGNKQTPAAKEKAERLAALDAWAKEGEPIEGESHVVQ